MFGHSQALLVTGCCVLGSLIVLLVSDGQPTKHWPMQPTVYLAIVTAIAHSSLALAHAQAVPVAWWYHAFRGGMYRPSRGVSRHTQQDLIRTPLTDILPPSQGPFERLSDTGIPRTVSSELLCMVVMLVYSLWPALQYRSSLSMGLHCRERLLSWPRRRPKP